jgi:hypothetical protein
MMKVAFPHRVSLLFHPSTPCGAVRGLDIQLAMAGPRLLILRYNLQGDMSRIRVGSESAADRTDGLWKHTCFEAFIQPGGSPSYYEFNFSPTRQWAAYRFNAYRDGMTPVDLTSPPEMVVRRLPDRLDVQAAFPLPDDVAIGAAPPTKLALTAVVEEDSGRLCYWSMQHAAGKPDFHHADGFALEL